MKPTDAVARLEHILPTSFPASSTWALLLALAVPLSAGGSDQPGGARCESSGPSGPDALGKPDGGFETRSLSAAPALIQADVYEEGIDVSDYWMSEKLDGVRAYWNGNRLLSRRGNTFSAPGWFLRELPSIPLDGELWMGRGNFELVSGTVRRQDPDDHLWRQVRYMVFDLPASAKPFGQRLKDLEQLLSSRGNTHVRAVSQRRIRSHVALMAELAHIRQIGGEGLMLHRDSSIYQASRSRDLLKLKPHLDAEATVVEHLPGKGKYTGMLGALVVENRDGTRFRIGTGFTDAQRSDPPPLGSVVTFKYHGHTRSGVPRFPSFIRVWDGH